MEFIFCLLTQIISMFSLFLFPIKANVSAILDWNLSTGHGLLELSHLMQCVWLKLCVLCVYMSGQREMSGFQWLFFA